MARNLARLREVAARAAAAGADVLVTPEATLTGYDIGPLDAAEPADAAMLDGAVDAVSAVAAEEGIALVVGVLRVDGDGLLRNSSVVAAGGEVTLYDKAHLFGDLDRSRFVPGSATHARARIGGAVVATLVCYDVEHPEAVRCAALDGAEVVLVPTANMRPYVGVNDLLVPARALENGVGVAYANHCGAESETRYLGRSLVVGPDGAVLARAGEGEELLVADVPVGGGRGDDEDEGDGGWGYLRDRRPELYGRLTSRHPPPQEDR